MKIRVFGYRWSKLVWLSVLVALVAVACQMSVDSQAQQSSGVSLSLIGAPEDRNVIFDLTVRGPGMATIREVIDPAEERELRFEVPARADISFTLSAQDDVYSGSVSRRFGPGADETVEIAVHPGPVFVDVGGEALYQVRDMRVDLDNDEEGTTWRRRDAAHFGDDAPKAAEYGPDGRLWVVAGNTLRAYETLELEIDNPTLQPDEEAELGITAGDETSIAVTEEHVYVFADGGIHRYEIGGPDQFESVFDAGLEAEIGAATGELLMEHFGLDEQPPGFDGIQDIAVGDNPVLYILYRTGVLDFGPTLANGLRGQFVSGFDSAFAESRLRRAVGDVIRHQLERGLEEAPYFPEVFQGVNFADIVALLESLAARDVDLSVFVEHDPPFPPPFSFPRGVLQFLDRPDFSFFSLLDYAIWLRIYAEEYWSDLDDTDPMHFIEVEVGDEQYADYARRLAAILEAVLTIVIGDLDEFLAEHEGEIGASQEGENGYYDDLEMEDVARAFALIAAQSYWELTEAQREELVAEKEFLEQESGMPNAESVLSLLPEDTEMRDQVLPVDFDIERDILDWVLNPDFFTIARAFLGLVGVDAEGNIVHGPTIVGPTSDPEFLWPTAPSGFLSFIGGGRVHVAQTTAEPAIIEETDGRRTDVINDLRFWIHERLHGGKLSPLPSMLGWILTGEFLQGLIDRFDAPDALTETLPDAMAGRLGDARAMSDGVAAIRGRPLVRFDRELTFRGSVGGMEDSNPSGAGFFHGPRRAATSRDDLLYVIDQPDGVLSGGRIVRVDPTTGGRWLTLESDFLEFFDTSLDGD